MLGALVVAAVAAVQLTTISVGLADEDDKTTVKVVLAESKQSDSEDKEYERVKLEKMTELASKRLRTRLEAAEVKHFSLETDPPRTILVSARGGISRALLAGIVVPQGRFALSAATPVGKQWAAEAAKFPEGVEIRQEEGSLTANDAYLWSRSKKKLRAVSAEIDFEGVEIHYYPADGGWRTLALANPVATHRDVSKATIRQDSTGDRYVTVEFDREVTSPRFMDRRQRTWAAVIDGEVVGTVERFDADFGDSFSLPAPSHLGSSERRRMWAQQVAGRLSAFLKVPLIEMTHD